MSLKNEVNSLLDENKTEEEIYSFLLSKGYSIKDIESSIKSVKKEKQAVAQPKAYLVVIGVFGAVVAGLGVFSLVAANWSYMSSFVKVLTLCVIMLAVYTIAIFLEHFQSKAKIWMSRIIFLLASIIYGANIFLIAQIYNLPIEWSDGFLYWFIGILGLVLVYRSFLLACSAVLVLLVGSLFFIPNYFGYLFSTSQFAEGSSILALCLALIFSVVVTWMYSRSAKEDFNKLIKS